MTLPDPWYDNSNPDKVARSAAYRVVMWCVVALLVCGVLSAVAWGVDVAISGVRGQGNAHIQKNQADNFIAAQTQFHQDFESIRTLDQRLTAAQKAVVAWDAVHPGYAGNGTPYDPLGDERRGLAQTATGLQQQCQIAVGKYDASTESYLSRDFRDANLPFKMQSDDPVFGSNPKWSDFDCLVTPEELK
jgi:cation transport regulator ChaB